MPFFFLSQKNTASGYYDIEIPLPYIHSFKNTTVFFLVARVLEVEINHITVL